MIADCGLRIADCAQPATPWDQRRRVIIVLAACVGMPVCLCMSSGVIARGVLTFDDGRFCVGDATTQFRADMVGAVTIEPDLVTVHLGAIA